MTSDPWLCPDLPGHSLGLATFRYSKLALRKCQSWPNRGRCGEVTAAFSPCLPHPQGGPVFRDPVRRGIRPMPAGPPLLSGSEKPPARSHQPPLPAGAPTQPCEAPWWSHLAWERGSLLGPRGREKPQLWPQFPLFFEILSLHPNLLWLEGKKGRLQNARVMSRLAWVRRAVPVWSHLGFSGSHTRGTPSFSVPFEKLFSRLPARRCRHVGTPCGDHDTLQTCSSTHALCPCVCPGVTSSGVAKPWRSRRWGRAALSPGESRC